MENNNENPGRRKITAGLENLLDKASMFGPKHQTDPNAPSAVEIAAIAESQNFTSREPIKNIERTATTFSPPPVREQTTNLTVTQEMNYDSLKLQPMTSRERRKPRYKKTGRTDQFTCRAKPHILDEFYQYVDDSGLLVGEVFELAWEALKEKTKGY